MCDCLLRRVHDLEAENTRLRDQLDSSDDLVKEQDKAFEEMSERLGDELRGEQEMMKEVQRRILDIHRPFDVGHDWMVCAVCNDRDPEPDGAWVSWPCPTALAVGVEE